ncbi:ion transporter [Limosilactobacillus sp. STM2_1]|uniref:Ion transporter n=1 Tax=Limosilactobacillus rudii TaxID=2759755 RepID=A0A7W3UIW0_9LACO|nr:ion transporter [Limosilactobacillus rudii]MBB1080064.1 ion transporter [Limosilactobacillus rudii]MBB1096448.1 ion transporter [Limosilactobacillus rudii]MCD7133551.1 ion channel [Limosilactobacillus rudii]
MKKKIYESIMVILAVVSILLIILDYGSVININVGYPALLNNIILVVFTVDYVIRFYLAKDKKKFFKQNFFDLISIIPVNATFNLFRFARIARFVSVLRIFRLIGLTGKLNRLLQTNGLIYVMYTSVCILVVSASMYSISEHEPFSYSLWWAIATATTIGYGDISPHTFLGKLAAILLMVVGIGFVGVLTSSITNFFIQDHTSDRMEEVLEKLNKLEEANKELQAEIKKINNETKGRE